MEEIEDTYAEMADSEEPFDVENAFNTESIYGNVSDQTAENDIDPENLQQQSDCFIETEQQITTTATLPPRPEIVRLTRLPMSRIKSIMKMDPQMALASAEAVFLVTKATELFLEIIAKEAYTYTVKSKKKTVSKKDLDTVIETVDALCFLDGALDF